jgi:hypothetical protein
MLVETSWIPYGNDIPTLVKMKHYTFYNIWESHSRIMWHIYNQNDINPKICFVWSSFYAVLDWYQWSASTSLIFGIIIIILIRLWFFGGHVKVRFFLYTWVNIWINTIINHVGIGWDSLYIDPNGHQNNKHSQLSIRYRCPNGTKQKMIPIQHYSKYCI